MPDIPQGGSQVLPETLPVVAHPTNSDGTTPNELVNQLLSLEKVVLPPNSKGCSSIPEGYELFHDRNGNYYIKNPEGGEMTTLEIPEETFLSLRFIARYDDTHMLCIGIKGDEQYARVHFQVFFGEDGKLHHSVKNKDGKFMGFYGANYVVNEGSRKFYPVWRGLFSIEDRMMQGDVSNKKTITYGINILPTSDLKTTEIDGRTYLQCSGSDMDDGLYKDVTDGINSDSRYYVIEKGFIVMILEAAKETRKLFSDFGGIYFFGDEQGDIPWVTAQIYKNEKEVYYIWTGVKAMLLDAFISLYNTTLEQKGDNISFGGKEYIWGVKKKHGHYKGGNVYFFEKRETLLPDGNSRDIWTTLNIHLPDSQIDADGNLHLITQSDIVMPRNARYDLDDSPSMAEYITNLGLSEESIKYFIFLGVSINREESPRERYEIEVIIAENGDVLYNKKDYNGMRSYRYADMFQVGNGRFQLGDFYEDFGYHKGLFYGDGYDWCYNNVRPLWSVDKSDVIFSLTLGVQGSINLSRGANSKDDADTYTALDEQGDIITYTDSRKTEYIFIATNLEGDRDGVRFAVCRKNNAPEDVKYEPFLLPKDRVVEFLNFLRLYGYTGNMNEFLQEGGGQKLLG